MQEDTSHRKIVPSSVHTPTRKQLDMGHGPIEQMDAIEWARLGLRMRLRQRRPVPVVSFLLGGPSSRR